MAESVEITNVYQAYIKNQPYIFPDKQDRILQSREYSLNTGYHILPTHLYRHFFKAKQWADLMIKYQAYAITGYDITVFNLVPLMTQLSFQQTQIFTSFNSAIYAIAYQDTHYETPWHNWVIRPEDNPNLAYTEGVIHTANNRQGRYVLPVYLWKANNTRYFAQNTASNSEFDGRGVWPLDGQPSGCFWNPMENPSKIMELRAGKNAITFSWRAQDTQFFNTDQLASWWPYGANGPYNCKKRPNHGNLSSTDDPDQLTSQYETTPLPVNDYTVPNWAEQPLLSQAWYWHEMSRSIAQPFDHRKTDLNFPGTEWEQTKFPPHQCFLKMVPIFDENDALIPITAQISIKATLHVKATPRQSAYHAPTWGPFAFTDLYSIYPKDHRFIHNMVRARTGGGRKTWQNVLRNRPSGSVSNENWKEAHAREDPYNYDGAMGLQINPAGGGLEGTYTYDQHDAPPKENLEITIAYDEPDRQVTKKQRCKSPMEIFTTQI
nr:MAG: capsid protein [Protoparvovirus sp.]